MKQTEVTSCPSYTHLHDGLSFEGETTSANELTCYDAVTVVLELDQV